MTIKMKALDNVHISALVMLTAKAAEGCSSCLDGYKLAAQKAGATSHEIQFALAAGSRAKASSELANNVDKTTLENAKTTLLNGSDKEGCLQRATANEEVLVLDHYFRAQGYQPIETAREAAYYEMGDKTSTSAYLPYMIDKENDRFAWIGYNIGQKGEDVIGVVVDLSALKTISDPATIPNPEQFIQATYIVEDGIAVAGHACDMNCFWTGLWPTCGGCLAGCLMAGPGWLACATVCCGANATVWCFVCGCC